MRRVVHGAPGRHDPALKSGTSSVVLARGATAGAIAGQAAVGKAGFRPAAATGLALMAAGSLMLMQVSIHGSYFPDIFVGLLLCGPGSAWPS
jgi:hypothetical protein